MSFVKFFLATICLLSINLFPVQAAVTPTQHSTETAGNGYGSNHIAFRNLAASIQTVKASNTTVYGISVINTQSSAATFVELFDQTNANSITLGTTSPDVEIYCPATSYCYAPIPPTTGVTFTLGVFAAAVTTEGGNTGSASGVEVWVFYK